MRLWRNLRKVHAAAYLLLLGGVGVFGAALAEDGNLRVEDLSQFLKAAGWQVERDADGALRLLPSAVEVPESDRVPRAKRQQESHSQPAAVPVDERFKDQLRRLGWRVVEESDGSLNLYPPSRSTEPVAQARAQPAAESVVAEPKTVRSAPVQTKRFEELLEERRWDVQREPDGSLVLRPKPIPAEGKTPTEIKDGSPSEVCEGTLVGSVQSGEIILPVDQWSEAQRIAQAWLNAQGSEGLAVGKIRKILRVYLVSVVEARSPYGLRHQIAIRNRDGAVVLLD